MGDNIRYYTIILLLLAAIISSSGCVANYNYQIQLQLDTPVDAATLEKVKTIIKERLNLYGINEVEIISNDNQNITVNLKSENPEDLKNLMESQGNFEVKISNQTVLTGADIVSVSPSQVTGTQWTVPFKISAESANKFAAAAKGKAGAPIDMYMDGSLITSPEIGENIANGVPTTDVAISGSSSTNADAQKEAKNLQILLQSGSLPVKIKVISVKPYSQK